MSSPESDPLQREFQISRKIEAPLPLVWEGWTEPKYLSKWWGPPFVTTPVCDMLVKAGEPYRIVMRGQDGVDYPITGKFLEVVEPQKIVMTQDCSEHPTSWHDAVDPHRSPDCVNPVGIMMVTVTFQPLQEASKSLTLLTITTEFESTKIRDAMVAMGMEAGWSLSLER
ncbi:MAG: SRPBCC domain-containing protein, partial [Cyanobacteria bacterium]|nr:SRPBCC domain-containing protein [Cyanobacteriota bacterium]